MEWIESQNFIFPTKRTCHCSHEELPLHNSEAVRISWHLTHIYWINRSVKGSPESPQKAVVVKHQLFQTGFKLYEIQRVRDSGYLVNRFYMSNYSSTGRGRGVSTTLKLESVKISHPGTPRPAKHLAKWLAINWMIFTKSLHGKWLEITISIH